VDTLLEDTFPKMLSKVYWNNLINDFKSILHNTKLFELAAPFATSNYNEALIFVILVINLISILVVCVTLTNVSCGNFFSSKKW